jgi:crotonobetainyl-CoA:carnitine CoA-transferase CaiB-like acyl-CoA transferase
MENREALGSALVQEFRKWSTAEILKRMVAEQVPVGPVLSLEELPDDAQIRHNECIVERAHPSSGTMRHPRPAARFDKTPHQPGRLAPLLGEHTEEILSELGYDQAAGQALRDEGVIP